MIVIILAAVLLEYSPSFRVTHTKVYCMLWQGFRHVLGPKEGGGVSLHGTAVCQVLLPSLCFAVALCLQNLAPNPAWAVLGLSMLPENHLNVIQRGCVPVIIPILSLYWSR